MRSYGSSSIRAFSRREFLWSAAVLPVLTCVSRAPALAEGTAAQHEAPYVALERFIAPGNDDFAGEKLAAQIRDRLHAAFESRELPLASAVKGFSPFPHQYHELSGDLGQAIFNKGDGNIGEGWRKWVDSLGHVRRIRFYVLPDDAVRYEVASTAEGKLLYRVGLWKQRWVDGRIEEFSPIEENIASADALWFRDVTAASVAPVPEVTEQLAHGIPYWRAKLDPASGIDIYGSNGIAVGDVDGDGVDEIYVCQPGGLPNRLLKFKADGTLTDITAAWGVGMLDDSSCALFLDLRNSGRQDLVVLRGSGPVLFLHEGTHYRLRTDAFLFETAPKGGFTGMAAADFDRDGKLDLYLCCYVYFQSEAQYTYASPYHDARNGPPNFLFRNKLSKDGSGAFEDCTAETGMMENNDRFSFAPAWCDYNDDGWPDLYVANDFGRKNLYRNDRGHFRDVASEAGVEDIGPGMSASWFDYNHDGRPDLYVANMWTDAGQRVVRDKHFAPAQADREAYLAHTMGNSLFRNCGTGKFEDTTAAQNAGFGRWAWSSGGHDLDNDGNPELFVTCGMLTNTSTADLNGFFWRQVVTNSPGTAAPSAAYENGWNALNQFVREEYSWSGHEPNVMHVRRGERYFDFSGISGLDYADDSRAFAILDFDGDGRPDVLLKSRLGPQLRMLQNDCSRGNRSIAFQLEGTKSNRDGIGARIEVDGRTKWLEAGSGFLSQHTKTLLFGMGDATVAKRVQIQWPSGEVQELPNLECGKTYRVTEGINATSATAFRERRPMEARSLTGNNELQLHDTWFLEPVPLPEQQVGPGLFVVKESSEEYEVFRRYLFDWRTTLKPPLAMLLNKSGDVAKVYATVPSDRTVAEDLLHLQSVSQRMCLPFEGQYVKPPKRDFFKFGAAFLWAGFPEQALPYLQRVLLQSPENARVLVLMGQIHLQADRINEAEKCFRQASQLSPDSLNAILGLADIESKRGSTSNAAGLYANALKVDPKCAEAANGLGLTLAKGGQPEQARAYFEQAIALRRDYADAINNLGVLYTNEGKVNDAIAAFRYGIQASPDEDILYLNLGRLFVKMGEADKARATMQELLDRRPDNATARRALQDLNGR